jgi:hypothetical protein
MTLANQQRKIRGELVALRINEAKTLAGLRVEKAVVGGERRTVEADLGPVRNMAPCYAPRTKTFCGISSSSWRCCSTRLPCCYSWQRTRS